MSAPAVQGSNTFVLIRPVGGTFKSLGCCNGIGIKINSDKIDVVCDSAAGGFKQAFPSQFEANFSLKGIHLYYDTTESTTNWSPSDSYNALHSKTEVEIVLIKAADFAAALTAGNTGEKGKGFIMSFSKDSTTNKTSDWSLDMHCNDYISNFVIA